MQFKKERARILIVDDEKMNLKVLAELLKDEYSPILATSGLQALKHAFGDTPPDLILLDVIMPEMGGYEIIKSLKNNEKTNNIPVIFVTSLDSIEDEEQGLKLGAVDYITKPFSPPIVKMRVRNHLRIVHQYKLLDQLAYLDGLTEIPNRRYFEQTFKKEWMRAIREDAPMSLVLADVDFFKQYNDNYGHAMGDVALQSIAHILEGSLLRPTDFVARYGGEEFVIVLPETDELGAKIVVERCLQNIAELNLPHHFSGIADHLTVSIGCATIYRFSECSPEICLKTADQNLYAAKQNGRNQMSLSVI